MTTDGGSAAKARDVSDPVLDALEELERAVRDNNARNERILVQVEYVRALRRLGRSYREVVAGKQRPLIVSLATDNLSALMGAGCQLRKAQARALHEEGVTMDGIAELFGVSRQRISQLLRAPSVGMPAISD